MSDPTLDDLKRRAFSSDGEDALAARHQLADLERSLAEEPSLGDPVEESAAPQLPRFTSTPWWAAALLGAASLAAIGTGIVTSLTPVTPLPIFDRPQTDADEAPLFSLAPDAVQGSSRWLASSLDVEIFGFLQEPENICLAAAQATNSLWTCITYDEFAKIGLGASLSQTRDDVVGILSIRWTPDGTLSTDWVEFEP
ncbi:MAG: hypothetical protein ACOH19_16410 [Rhodoglobus sp.]